MKYRNKLLKEEIRILTSYKFWSTITDKGLSCLMISVKMAKSASSLYEFLLLGQNVTAIISNADIFFINTFQCDQDGRRIIPILQILLHRIIFLLHVTKKITIFIFLCSILHKKTFSWFLLFIKKKYILFNATVMQLWMLCDYFYSNANRIKF